MRILLLLLALLAGPGAALARPVVAVIDSGVAKTPELEGIVVGEHDMAAWPARPAFQPRYDHGTMVATILTREAKQGVSIVSFRIDDPAGCPQGATPPCQPDARPVAAAIRLATRMGVDAINISLAMKDAPAIVDAVREAAEAGITVVLAAGNDGRSRPANRAMARVGGPHAVLVGAVDAQGRPWAMTNRPEAQDERGYDYVWRFGVDVPTAGAGGQAVYATGTSFAAPIETARRVSAMAEVQLAEASREQAPTGDAGGARP